MSSLTGGGQGQWVWGNGSFPTAVICLREASRTCWTKGWGLQLHCDLCQNEESIVKKNFFSRSPGQVFAAVSANLRASQVSV